VLLTLGQELLIGVVLGLLARLTIASLQIADSVVAQPMGLGFVTAVDPAQGQQGNKYCPRAARRCRGRSGNPARALQGGG